MKSETSDAADSLARAHERFVQAVKAGDVPAILSLQSEDVVWMPHNETSVYGIDEVKEWFEEYFEHFRIPTMAETERDVTLIGAWAVERWAYMLVIVPIKGGERIRDDGRSLNLWKQEDGSWKMAQIMFNSMRPIGSGTSRFLARMAQKRKEE